MCRLDIVVIVGLQDVFHNVSIGNKNTIAAEQEMVAYQRAELFYHS